MAYWWLVHYVYVVTTAYVGVNLGSSMAEWWLVREAGMYERHMGLIEVVGAHQRSATTHVQGEGT